MRWMKEGERLRPGGAQAIGASARQPQARGGLRVGKALEVRLSTSLTKEPSFAGEGERCFNHQRSPQRGGRPGLPLRSRTAARACPFQDEIGCDRQGGGHGDGPYRPAWELAWKDQDRRQHDANKEDGDEQEAVADFHSAADRPFG